jgi:hypothetical protein
LPKDVARLGATSQDNPAAIVYRQSGRNLENVDAFAGQSEIPRYGERGGGLIQARDEGLPAQISGHADYAYRPSSGVVIGAGQEALRLLCGSIGGVYRPDHDSGPKPSDPGPWPNPQVPVNNAEARVGNRGAGQNRELAGRYQVYRQLVRRREVRSR